MDYRYQKNQIFRKKLKVPKYILSKVYNCTLSFNEFIKYELDDKIPISCLSEDDRQIVERFGVEQSKTLDWELINKRASNVNFRDLLMTIDPSNQDINMSLYELAKDELKPSDYTERMKQIYSDRLFDISQSTNQVISNYAHSFNDGRLSLKEIINNWEIFKDKDLSYCLKKDIENKFDITSDELKEFMELYEKIAHLIVDNSNIYSFIHELNNLTNEQERKEYLKRFTDNILNKTYKKYNDWSISIELTDDEYKEMFKYSSIEDYLKIFNKYDAPKLIEELKTLPHDYIFTMPIPFTELRSYHVLSFIATFGLKNIVDFDNECGQFFTKNNCEMLNLMFDMYMHYGGNEPNPQKNIYYDKDGHYINEKFSKDQFYEAMRRMIVYGPSDGNYSDKAPDYRNLTGEFRERNQELFIIDNAPEELQKLFYTKSITPQLIVEHPEYVSYLKGKDLSSCFKTIEIKILDSSAPYGYESLYDFISKKVNFNETMDFITEYSDVFDITFNSKIDRYRYKIDFQNQDNMDETKQKINECLRKIIIEQGLAFPKLVPQSLINSYPSMFLSSDAPQGLKDAYYNRTITSDLILSNPNYIEYLKGIDLEILYKYMPVKISNNQNDDLYNYNIDNLISCIEEIFGYDDAFDLMLIYSKYIEKIFEINKLQQFKFNPNYTKDELLDEIDSNILQAIIEGKIRYDENIPSHFKNNNPTLFLNDGVSIDIKDKFYNRMFTIDDFNSNPELLDIFEKTNIVCGFPESYAWMITLFDDDLKIANLNRLKVISAYSKIDDVPLQNAFKEYILEFGKNIDIQKIEYVSEVLSRLSLSNSSEIFTFRKELGIQILKSSDPIESLNKIEDVFIRNNIPTVGKIYSCFEILHPNFEGFNFQYGMISPVLTKKSTAGKKIIVFSDLIKASFGSNNKSVNTYLKNIEIGSKIYESIKLGEVKYDDLDETQKNELITFSKHLSTLYFNTLKGKEEQETFKRTEDVVADILELSKRLSPNGTLDYNLADRVISMFCHFAGINTLEEAKNYISSKIKTADARNRSAANSEMTLEPGDFVKGIGGITYLRNILQNGSVSKEYLGSSAGSDATPLDTDVSMIMSSDGTISEKMRQTAANSYGPIWFVLKKDDRFITTRPANETYNIKNDMSKLEVFYTGALGEGHYGIRTGFSSSDINYIVMENYDERVGLEIVMNGFYIPIANKEGKIIFTPDDYDKLRRKMCGLSYFDENDYIFSDNLITKETELIAQQIEESNKQVQTKRKKINEIIKNSLEELGLHLKTNIDGDLSEGYVELIDTGSTGRGTNKPGDGDFDFMMRLDRSILSSPAKLQELKRVLLRNLGNSSGMTGTGDFRLKGVQIDIDTNVDIDITFTEKTDRVSYSTDMALQDRLTTIMKSDSEKYKYVVANILLAKQVLKQGGVYKPNRGEIPQGGLGGVGIENWILQNGGSFIDAVESFLKAADGKSFDEFKAVYQIWDFGENHLAERRGKYSHDNFVANNMDESGYNRMVQILKEYMKNYVCNQEDMISENENMKK